MGFYTHAYVSTSAIEALMMGFGVSIDYNDTGACGRRHELPGGLPTDDVKKSALLQLANIDATIIIDSNEFLQSKESEFSYRVSQKYS